MNVVIPDIFTLPGPAAQVGESPVWLADTEELLWIDIGGRALFRWHKDAGTIRKGLPDVPGALMLAPDGPVLAMEGGIYRLHGEKIIPIVESLLGTDDRFNDGVLDSTGQFVLGVVPRDRSSGRRSSIALVRAEHLIQLDLSVGLPNGFALTPKEDTLFFSDTDASVRRVYRFDYAPGHGPGAQLSCFMLPEGRPDGGSIDTRGTYWCAAIDAGALIALDPKGQACARIVLPVPRPTNLVFAGSDVFVTTMQGGDDPRAGLVLLLNAEAFGQALNQGAMVPAKQDC